MSIIYKWQEIFPFFSDKFVPNHIIKEYYQGERDSIDRKIRLASIPRNNNSKSVNEYLDEFLEECNE